jgi:PAS domain S-box-containing protein
MKDQKKTKEQLIEELAQCRQRVTELEAAETELKWAEEALRESKEKYREIINGMNDTVWVIAFDGKFIDVNETAVKVLGYSREELLSMGPAGIDSHLAEEQIEDLIRRMPSDEIQVFETEHTAKEGKTIPVEISSSLVSYQGKRAILSIARDITKRKRAEEALRDSRRMLQTVLDSIPSTVFWKDRDSIYLGANRALLEAAGLESSEEIAGKSDYDLPWGKNQADSFREDDRRVMESGIPEYDIVEPYLRADGTHAWAKTNKVPLRDMEGNIVGVLGTYEDITERKRAEEALRESEERYRSLFDRVPVGLYRTTPAGQILDANPALVQMLGYPDQESLLAVSATDVYVNGKDRAREQALLEREEVVRHFETQMRRRDGADIWVRDSVRAVRNADDRVLCYEGSLEDITERKRAEEALQRSEQFLQDVFDAIQDGISVLDADLNVIRTNHWIQQMYAHQMPLSGRKCYRVYQQRRSPCPWCPTLRTIETGKAHTEIVPYPSKDNPTGWIELTAFPLKNERGHVTSVIEYVKDITERKRAEEKVRRHLERAEALREIDRAVTSTLDLPKVLDIILKELERVIPYHSAGIFLFSNSTAKLTAGRGFPDPERVLQVSFPVQEDVLTREVLQEKRPLVLADAQADKRFLARGGTEYVRSWIGVPLVAKGRALGFLTVDHREAGVYDGESAETVQAFASQAAIAIENARLYQEAQRELAERKRAEQEVRQSYVKLRTVFGGTVNVLVSAIEMRDPYTAGHQQRVTQLACAIANEMGLPEEQIEGIHMAALIHDLGKINVPADILSKPGRLTEIEFGLIKMHPQVGHDVLSGAIEFPWPVAETVLQHHERMDGSGYPQGLSGDEIILEARILAVADVVEAMASHRPYRAAHSIEDALDEISQNRGILYDPEVVDACLKLFTEKGFEFE